VRKAIQEALFRSIHGNNLVYNTCWEDPRLDREVLSFSADDRVVVITSAGCNALDYLLAGAGHVHAVDVNPRQNALLELKRAAILELSYDDLFSMFGRGVLRNYRRVYADKLHQHLSSEARQFWDKKISFFAGTGWQKSFYFRGSSGLFARLINIYIDRIPELRGALRQLFETNSLEEQSSLYYSKVKPRFWGPLVRWIVGRDVTLAMLGVPRSQRMEVDTQYPGGIVKFIEDCLDAVFGVLPLRDNYFWRLYVFGEYSEDCCPEYLKRENNERLKELVVGKISTHTGTLTDFLDTRNGDITRFILLDHMDWLSAAKLDVLRDEWQSILKAGKKGARMIWRSGGVNVTFVDPLMVEFRGKTLRLGDLLTYYPEITQKLHQLDRVHTYGSFYLATLGQETIEDTVNRTSEVFPANGDQQESSGRLVDLADLSQTVKRVAVN
jgi:S-adenosylmethionine-diacylglycerol 3-amino-3-carboxypropyl transferase